MGSSLHAQQLVTSLTAGLIAGIRTILGSASMVVLVMPNGLPGGIAPALELILTGGVVVGALVALFSSYPGVVAQVQDGPAVIIGVMATALAATMGSSVPPALAVLVVLASANVAAFAAGAVFYGLGVFRLGALMRFIPFPVVGGFLAGSGLLILLGAIPVLTGVAIPKIDFQLLSEPLRAARWLPGLAFGLLLLAMLRRYRHPLLVPGLLLAAVALYHLGLHLAGMTVGEAQAAGLLLGPFPDFTGLEAPAWIRLSAEEWSHVAAHIPTFASILLVSVVALLLNASGLELATRSDLDINRELRAAGLANMASGLLGGAVGFHALSASLLGYRMGANSRVIGLASAALCLAALLFGTSLLAYMPRAVLGGLLFSMGAGLLIEWLYDGWRRLPLQDFLIVALIVAVIGAVSIPAGVAVGVAVAMVIFVLSYSRVRVIRQELSGADYRSNVDRNPAALAVLKAQGSAIRVIKLEGFIFFGTAYSVLTRIQQMMAAPGPRKMRFLLLDFRDVPASDSSAMLAFSKISTLCERNACQLLLTRMNSGLRAQFRQSGIEPAAGSVSFHDDLDEALEQCEQDLLRDAAGRGLPGDVSGWERIRRVLPEGATLSDFMAYLEPRNFAAGDYLLRQGGPPDEILFIETGRVTVRLGLPDGRSMRLRSLTGGTMIGEIGMYLNQPRNASAIADETTEAYVLHAAKLRDMERSDPQLANALHQAIAALLAERLSTTNGLLQRLID
ncbi:MAG: SulP family inorganic anion transporter [Aestuariivirga sp.]|uniref:SLC26A/SulP transporter family protein n=1 Tax=Aestuariivirga sp. TaxID=2650926 RepID=UPI00301AA7F7